MDNILPFIGYAIISLGLIGMYTPSFQLRNSERFTGKELGKKYPEYEWIRRGFISIYLGWLVIVGIFFYQVLPGINFASLVSAFFASIGLFIGSFAIITGVSILPMNAPLIFYVIGNEARKAGRFQVAWSLSVLIFAFAVEVLR